MVARKSSIPQPTIPPPPPPSFGPSQANHHVDSSDVPPIPTNAHQVEEDSPYKDMGNPWADTDSPVASQSSVQHPEILRPGIPQPATTTSEIPDIFKPGWSAQNTPRSSIDSGRSRDFWESTDDEEEQTKVKGKAKAKDKDKQGSTEQQIHRSGSTEDMVIPSPLQIKRKPIGSPLQAQSGADAAPTSPRTDFASNNPFRHPSSDQQLPPVELLPSWGSAPKDKGKGKEPASPPLNQLGNLSLDDNRGQPGVATHQQFSTDGQSTSWDQQQRQQEFIIPPQPSTQPPQIPGTQPTSPFSQQPPLIPVPKISSPFSEQPPLIPVSPPGDHSINPWSSHQNLSAVPSPIPFAPSQKQNTHSTEDLLDRDQKAGGRISLGDELRALPNAVHTSTSQTPLLDDQIVPPQPARPAAGRPDDEYIPPPGPPPSHISRIQSQGLSPPPPTKPPRPAVVVKPLSDAEIAQLQEQRNETYQIKHFNWFDHRLKRLRTSSMLTQNKNGPCPLLALVNALILGAGEESQAALDNALRSREQVTLGLIIETLMDELLSSDIHMHGELPDMDELNRFLLKLRTGMNMNPRFVQPRAAPPNLMDARNSVLHMPAPQAQDQPGGFESTQDVRLYSAFGIQTVHGWLPEPNSEVARAFNRSAQNYEDAQVIQFGEEELDYKLSNDGLTPQEQRLWEDIVSIKNFFRLHPTQLTPYGLECIKQSMQPGSFAILFRNDHFSTIYRHLREGNLYTLITDAGYADRDEVIWESLVDISGQEAEFFSGDFQSVSHHGPDSSQQRSSHLTVDADAPEPLSPQQQQEQHDADFAMALQLQEEEEQRMRQERGNRASSGSGPAGRGNAQSARGGTTAARGNTASRRGQGIPIPLRSNNSGTENRPLIPPRNQRSSMPAVNRPSDALDSDAPPTYEEAARGKPYNPPLGSPLHPQSSASAEPSPYNSTSQVNLSETTSAPNQDMPPALRRPQRRQSAYSETFERYGHSPRSSSGRFEMGMSPAYSDRQTTMPGSYIHTGRGGHGQGVGSGGMPGSSSRNRREDGECTVM